MSCPVCHTGSTLKPDFPPRQVAPTNYANYPPYAGPTDTLSLANERPLSYPYIHAKVYNRRPAPSYVQAQQQAKRHHEKRCHHRDHKASGVNIVGEALQHLRAAEKLLS